MEIRQRPWLAGLAMWVAAPQVLAAQDVIRLKNREIRVTEGKESAAGGQPAAAGGDVHYLVSVGRPVNTDDHGRLAALGFRVLAAAPDSGLVVTATQDARWLDAGFTWIGTLEAADKWSRALDRDDAAGVYLVEAHPEVRREWLAELAGWEGLTPREHPDLLPNQLLVEGQTRQLRALAERDEVAYVFPASADLAAGERVATCPGAVSALGMIGQYAKVGKGWPRDPDGWTTLGVQVGALTDKIPRAAAQAEIERALEEWARHARLRFAAAISAVAPRTIALFFARGSHGDPYPFDGPGRVLAHAFYPAPPNPEPWAGDLHFDADENWAVGRDIDLYTVVLHELGHALGLGHSDRPGAVMYPYYRRAAGLHEDDIAGIRDLYGPDRPDGGGPPPDQRPAGDPIRLMITSPDSAVVHTTGSAVTVRGTASGGKGTLRITWRDCRGASGSASGSPEWRTSPIPLATGVNEITVTAADDSQDSRSATVRVIREQAASPGGSPPSLEIVTPAAASFATLAAALEIRGTASHGVVRVEWSTSLGGQGAAQGTTRWSIAAVPLLVGVNRITVRAWDAGGRHAWRSLTVTRR